MIHFGFSYIGLLFLLMLIIPNINWNQHKPKDYVRYVGNENKVLLWLERIGRVLVCCISLIFSDFNVRAITIWSIWLGLAFLAMLCYEAYWIKYFKSEMRMEDLHSSFLGIPVAGASLPVIAYFFLGIYGNNIFMLIAAAIFGIGHIGIHLAHRKEVYFHKKKRGIVGRIVRGFLVVFLTLILAMITVTIGARNYNAIKGAMYGPHSIEEEGYIEINGQKQYYLIRGDNVNNPIIIWIHGGPASPDTMATFYLSNELADEYTIIAYNQRGCGRTYFKNLDTDPKNETATFEQLQEDLDCLIDYALERFGQNKVILTGHSFGTMVGSKYAMDHPEKVSYYIGVGQMGALGSDLYVFRDAIDIAQNQGDDTTAMEQAISAYQESSTIESMLTIRELTDAYHPVEKTRNYIIDAYTSPYMDLDDIRWFLLQLNLSKFVKINQSLFDYIGQEDVYFYGTEFQMPVGFISGSCDWITPVQYTKDYYHTITAPKKEMKLIEGWGHMLPLENPKEFASALKQMIAELSVNE
jgi:pimeloyl-ACP methyl ester carboxylesterase